MARKHVPHRTCIACREVRPKRDLVRIVRTPDGVHVDERGKLSGRGAYVCRDAACWEKVLTGGGKGLSFALKTTLTDDDRHALMEYASSLQALGEDDR